MPEPANRPSLDEQAPSVLPTARELVDAMYGVVPEGHPAAFILRAACLLAAVEEWIQRHRGDTERGTSASAQAGSPLIERAADTLRAYLVEGVADASPEVAGVGEAVGQLAATWVEWRNATNNYPDRQAATRKSLLGACDSYDQVARQEIALECSRVAPHGVARTGRRQSPRLRPPSGATIAGAR